MNTDDEQQQRTLYIGNISFEATEDDIIALIQNAGLTGLQSFSIVRNTSGRSHGYGFAVFESVEQAQAGHSLSGTELNGRQLRVNIAVFDNKKESINDRYASNTKRLYIGNIPYLTQENEVRELLEQFGVIENIDLIRDSNGVSRGFAFVSFRLSQDANAAIDGLSGYRWNGRLLRVKSAHDKKERTQEERQINNYLQNYLFNEYMNAMYNAQPARGLYPAMEENQIEQFKQYRRFMDTYFQENPQMEQHPYGAPSQYGTNPNRRNFRKRNQGYKKPNQYRGRNK